MDDKLRQLPGVELFRRSRSLVANPSSQGMSLRGLGSTSASRTLLTLDDVPLNDPVGGWIHWLEQPQLAIGNIDVVRGGASDLYGSSAIGGVMNLGVARPSADAAELRSTLWHAGTYAQAGSPRQAWPLGRDGRRRAWAPTAISRRRHGSAGRWTSTPTWTPRMLWCLGSTTKGRYACLRAAAGSTRTGPTARPTRSTARACGATPWAATGRRRTRAR